MQIKRKKRLIISLLLTLVIMLCTLQLYSRVNMDNFSRAWNSKEARLNIFFGGNKDNQLRAVDLSKRIRSEQPEWYNNPKGIKTPGRGTMVQAKISRLYKKYKLEYKAIGDGTVSIYLLGPYNRWNDGKFYPVWVYYKNFKVNGKEVFSNTKKLSYEKGYKYDISLKNGEVIKIEFEAKRHIPINLISEIEPLLFISCLAISFLLSRLLVYWLSKFKIREHHSRIDIVFLSVFFALLLIPMSRIDRSEKSEQENRMLAKYIPLLYSDGGINLKYGKDFEAWFNDHFNFRNKIIRNYNTLKYKLNRYFSGQWYNNEIYFAKDGWMFDSFETRKFLGFNQEQTDKTIQNFKKLKNSMEKRGIKFYFFISPTKGDIYAEYNIRYLLEKDKTEELVNIISKNSGVKIYYPRQKYLEAKESEMIFYKTDHHSTEYATWIAYQDLSTQIKHDFPEYYIASLDNYAFEYDNMVHFETHIHKGTSAERINVDVTNHLDKQYKYFIPKNQSNIKISKVSDNIYDYHNNLAQNDLRVMLIGNSFTENFVKFLPYSVQDMRKYRTNNIGLQMKFIESEIKKYNPDIVIFALHSSWINNLSTMY